MHVKECAFTTRKGRNVTGLYSLNLHADGKFYTRNGIRVVGKHSVAVKK